MLENEHILLEFLQVTELMEKCAREGLYEEALDLEAYVKSMCHRHPDIPILVTNSHFHSLILFFSFV
jgi:hypothetical protein